jgi:hypothetical protein
VLKVQARATGRRQPLAPDRELPADGWGALTLRELIERVVRGDGHFLNALTEGDIEDGADEIAVAVALQAFEDGLYLVLIDGRRQRRLDAPVQLGADSTLTFLRLGVLA